MICTNNHVFTPINLLFDLKFYVKSGKKSWILYFYCRKYVKNEWNMFLDALDVSHTRKHESFRSNIGYLDVVQVVVGGWGATDPQERLQQTY